MNNKIEQGTKGGDIVKNTSIKLNKSIDFLCVLCQDKSSRDDQTKTKNKRYFNKMEQK